MGLSQPVPLSERESHIEASQTTEQKEITKQKGNNPLCIIHLSALLPSLTHTHTGTHTLTHSQIDFPIVVLCLKFFKFGYIFQTATRKNAR